MTHVLDPAGVSVSARGARGVAGGASDPGRGTVSMRPKPLQVWGGALLAACLAAPSSEAAIVHVSQPGIVLGLPNGPNQAVIDVNGDGVNDFLIDRWSITTGHFHGFDHNFVIADGEGDAYFLTPAPSGAMLDWAYSPGACSLVGWFHSGNWLLLSTVQSWPSEPAYLGIAFRADDQYHFGWMSLSIGWVEGVRGVVRVHEYAYESSPGVPIVAGAVPAPGAAAVLGLGLLGVSRRRRGRR